MADGVLPPATPGSPGSPAPGQQTTGSPQSPGISETTPSVTDLAKQFAAFQAATGARLDGLSATVNRVEKAAVPKSADPPKADPAGLTEKVQALEKRQAALDERAKQVALREAANQLGISGPAQDVLIDRLRARNAQAIIVDESTGAVRMRDQDREVALPDFLRAYLQTDEGKLFIPPKANPQLPAPGGATPGGAVTRVTRADVRNGKVDFTKFKPGTIEIVD